MLFGGYRMKNLRVLERKDKKKFLELLKKQFGFKDISKRSFESLSNLFDKKLDYVFLINNKNKVFIVNKDIADIELSKTRINSIGLYIAEFKNDEVRLSIEGSQIIGVKAEKNVVDLDEKEARKWLKGEDLDKKVKAEGFVILKCGKDYLGCGKLKEGRILNFVPKTRRLNVSD